MGSGVPATPRAQRAGRWRRRAALALLLLAVLAAVGLGLFPQEPLRRLAEKRLVESLGPQSRIGHLQVVPGRLSVVARDLEVEAPGYRLVVPRVRVRAHPSLLLGSLSLAALEAESPRLTLRAGGTTDAPADLPNVEIDRLDVRGGRLDYVDTKREVLIDGIEAKGAVGKGAFDVSAALATLKEGPRTTSLGPARARVRLSSDLRLEIESSEVRSGDSRAALRGSVGPVESPDLDLAFEADVSPADVVRASGEALSEPARSAFDGRLRLEGTAKGPLPELKAAARVEGAALGGAVGLSLETAGTRFRAEASVSRADLERAGRIFDLGSLPVRGAFSGRAVAEGDLDHVRIEADLDAEAAGEGLRHRLRASLEGGVRPRAASVDGAWRARIDTVATRGPAGLQSAELSLQGTARGPVPPVVDGRLEGVVGIRAAGESERLRLTGGLHGRGSSLRAQLAGHGPSERLDATIALEGPVVESLRVDVHADDLGRLVPSAAGRVEATVAASGEPSALNADVRARGEGVEWNGVKVGAVTLQGTSERGRGRLTLAAPEWNAGGEAVVERGIVRGTAQLADTPLSPLSPLLPRPVEGRVAARATFEAPLAAPDRAKIAADVTALDVTSGSLEAHAARPFTVRYADGTLRLEEAALEGSGLSMRASGEATVAGRLDLSVAGELDLARAPVPAPWTAAGSLEGELRVEGDRSRPRVSGSAKLVDLALSGTASIPLLRGSATLRFDEDRVVLDRAELALAEGNLRIEGEVPVAALASPAPGTSATGGESARLEADWSALQLRALLASFGAGTESPVEGSLSGHLQLRGPLRADAAEGELMLRAEGLRVGDVGAELTPLSASLRGGALVVAPFELASSGGRLQTTLRADLARRSVEASSRGAVDLRPLSPLVGAASLGGQARVDVVLRGPFGAVAGNGRVELEDVSIRLREVPQPVTEGRGAIVLDGSRIAVEDVTARLGGGTLALSGSARMAGATALEEVHLSVKGQDVSLRYPGDFKSRVEADLELKGRTGDLVLGGQVKVLRGLYDSDIQIEDALRLSVAAAEKTPEAIASVGLDINVSTRNPILVRNNLAELDVTGRLDVRGDVADPAPFGRLEIREGGKVFLQTREFTVERGALVYQGTFEPEIDVRAKTVIREPAGDVEVTVAADGPLLGPTLHLSSVPDYSEKEIASLVATGRRNVALDSTAWVAGEQAAALLAGRVTRSLSRGFEQLGLDEVTIQPELLAREADPSARFTFGKHVTPHFRLIYSIGLSDAEERFVEGQYRFRLGREITTRLIRDDEGVLTYGVGQRWRFGVPDRRARSWTPRKIRLAEVRLKGDAEAIAGGVPRQPGDEVTTWDLLADAERIQRRLRRAGHLEALVSSDMEGQVATFTVNAGPRYVYEVQGLSSPPRLDDVLSSALYEEEALDEGRRRLLDAARARGHLRARVSTSVVEEERGRCLVFAVDSGPLVKDVQVRFPGASALGEGELLRAAGGAGALLTSAAAAREAILAAYHERWYLSAEVDPPRVVEAADGSRVTIEVPVREGPRARLAVVRFEGTTQPDEDLRRAVALEPGPVPEPETLTQAARRLRDEYLERGYVHARVRPRLSPAGTDLEVVFDVDEGERRTVGAVRIAGLRRTKESLVRRRVDLRPGDPLDPRRLGVLEKRLLDLGVFSRVVVTASDEEPAVVDVRVEEQGPFSVAYDVRFSEEERATTLVDVEAGNLGGIGLAVGGRYRVGRDLRETRASVHLPSFGRGGDTTASVFQVSEDFRIVSEGETGQVLEDTSVQKGFQLQQTIHSAGRWTVLGGFTFKNVSSRLTDLSHDLSGLQASVVRESRDNPLDARAGSFLSLSLEGGGGWTASDFDYFRLFAQGFDARPLGRAFTWAQGYRLGLARGLEAQRDQQLSVFARSTELFHAGGPTSLRGYALDSVGPTGPHGFNPGGEALVVINQEIRYRHPWGVGAAVFYDVGNVFARVQDIGLDLRHSLGAGLRYDSPIGLLRLDIGFPLNPRPQDRGFQWFFALGQAF